jgi:hypothetical protein
LLHLAWSQNAQPMIRALDLVDQCMIVNWAVMMVTGQSTHNVESF